MLFVENTVKAKKQPIFRGFMLEKVVRFISFIAPFFLISASFTLIPVEGFSFTVCALLAVAALLIHLEFRNFEITTVEL